MSLIALELADAGIMAAGGDPARLLTVDQGATISPGFALPVKKKLTVGHAAQAQAHLYPQGILNHFWERLNTEPLAPPIRPAGNHAEIALAHLAMVWDQIKAQGREVLLTIPGFMSREQLGLILGLARELAIEVKGFIPQALVAAPHPLETDALFYLDLHLHRTEVASLHQNQYLELAETLTLDGFGLLHLHRLWVESIAEEFVRTTRFDPLHDAPSEQVLYDRLPEILDQLNSTPTISFKQRAGQTVHTITLAREMLAARAATYFRQLGDLIQALLQQQKGPQRGLTSSSKTILVTHRAASLPGLAACLHQSGELAPVILEPGAAALNALGIWDQLGPQAQGSGAYFFNRRPWSPARPAPTPLAQETTPKETIPTHLLYLNRAYPITAEPLAVTSQDGAGEAQLLFHQGPPSPNRPICTLHREGDRIVLTADSQSGIYVDSTMIQGRALLELGQVIRPTQDGEPIRLIACMDAHSGPP